MRSPRIQFDREKFKEVILLLADYCPSEELGNVKLHKILYFADMLCYLNEGRPITGVEYLKQKFGPTARHLSAALAELESEGRLKVEERSYYGFLKKSFVNSHSYVPDRISTTERQLLFDVADFVRGRSAKEISELSHNSAWEAAGMGEIIPYYSALSFLPSEIGDEDRSWAVDAARDHASSRPL